MIEVRLPLPLFSEKVLTLPKRAVCFAAVKILARMFCGGAVDV
jgi:hypothetical protein